ncbi:cupin domain-containing protein [Priestia koreensis]|uniref:cupin domain-containing protein n=1 Tax=Priestia koreensis TaxID=284581 RepID=UPI001F55BC6F|nr:cupin domain-containing protein [Priestia koreensis]UNL83551.1 cupin domain-containing protein [Priestia koreensis]
MDNVQTLFFKDDGTIPNNPLLPVLIYHDMLGKKSVEVESIFNQCSWLNSWTNGIFNYHHYHSNAHEVLGVIKGHATVQLGGESGKTLAIKSGDVIVLPAGTGHKLIESSDEFKVAGAYPNGMSYDVKTDQSEGSDKIFRRIKQVPLPKTDPIFGKEGPLLHHWNPTRGENGFSL